MRGRAFRAILLVFVAADVAALVSTAGYTAWLLGALGAVLIFGAVRFAVWLRRGSALR